MRSAKQRSRSKSNRPRTLGNIINRVFDSSGPEGKVRGTPQQIIEKYQLLARDAQLSNDRVAAENFQQHAEHYTRMLAQAQREMQAEADARRQQHEEQQRQRQQDEAQRQRQNDERARNTQPRRDEAGRADTAADQPQAAAPQPRNEPEGFAVQETETDADTLVLTPEAQDHQPSAAASPEADVADEAEAKPRAKPRRNTRRPRKADSDGAEPVSKPDAAE